MVAIFVPTIVQVLATTIVGQWGLNVFYGYWEPAVEPTAATAVYATIMPSWLWTTATTPAATAPAEVSWLWWCCEAQITSAAKGLMYAAGQITVSMGVFGFTSVYNSLGWFVYRNIFAIVYLVILWDLLNMWDAKLRQLYPKWFTDIIVFFVEKPTDENSHRIGHIRRLAEFMDNRDSLSNMMETSPMWAPFAAQVRGMSGDSVLGFIGFGGFVGDLLSYGTLLPALVLGAMTFSPIIWLQLGIVTLWEMVVSLEPTGILDFYNLGNTYQVDILLRVADKSGYTSIWVHAFYLIEGYLPTPSPTSSLRRLTSIWKSTLCPLMIKQSKPCKHERKQSNPRKHPSYLRWHSLIWRWICTRVDITLAD